MGLGLGFGSVCRVDVIHHSSVRVCVCVCVEKGRVRV